MAAKKDNTQSGREQTKKAEGQATGAARQAAESAGGATRAAAEEAERTARKLPPEFESAFNRSAGSYQELFGMSQEGLGRVMQSGTRMAQGLQEISWEMMHFTQQSMERSMRAASDMMSSRSLEDMIRIQQSYLRESLDMMMDEGTKLMQMSSRMADEAAQPVSGRQP